MKILQVSKLLIVISMISVIFLQSIPVSGRDYSAPETITLPEGNDFATLELRDPWDMDAFTDVSLGFNSTGSDHYLKDFQVSDGVFSARTSSGFPSFHPLYPGNQTGMRFGKTGVVHPIDTSKYQCFSMAMYVDPGSLSYHNISWIEDLNITQGGLTYGMKTSTGIWRLYSYNLSTYPYQNGSTWNTKDWLGLRIKPIDQADKFFAVDWIRLTDCTAVNYTLDNLPTDTDSIWIGTGSPERLILVATGISESQFTLDVQGIQPGTYNLYVKNASGDNVQATEILVIEPAPIPSFTNPSPIIGADYATLAGNPWDMKDNQDIIGSHCTSYEFLNDILYVDTLSPSGLPSSCIGGGANEADPKLYLNTPIADDITQYRYLSFRHNIKGQWSRPIEGMILRLIWEMSGLAPRVCKYVSRQVSLDVGWQTYWVDLYDPYNGIPAEVGGVGSSACPDASSVKWKSQPGSLSQFRLDPNENVLSSTMHQEFDWIRLTKVPSVFQGVPFPIQVSMNKSPDRIQSITFYYTTDVNQPTQHPADGSMVVSKTPQADMNPAQDEALDKIFLPLVFNKYAPPIVLPPVENEIKFLWDTKSVAPGEYYVCAVTFDGYNQTTFCSHAPVQIKP
jgi:hypothetical protein